MPRSALGGILKVVPRPFVGVVDVVATLCLPVLQRVVANLKAVTGCNVLVENEVRMAEVRIHTVSKPLVHGRVVEVGSAHFAHPNTFNTSPEIAAMAPTALTTMPAALSAGLCSVAQAFTRAKR